MLPKTIYSSIYLTHEFKTNSYDNNYTEKHFIKKYIQLINYSLILFMHLHIKRSVVILFVRRNEDATANSALQILYLLQIKVQNKINDKNSHY